LISYYKFGASIYVSVYIIISNECKHLYTATSIYPYTGYPNFAVARELSSKHKDHNIPTWRKLFKAVNDLLIEHDSEDFIE
jgi:hypothetical protein